MYVRSIQIDNFKGIEHCQLNFNQGVNLLIGANGHGKTSILEALAVSLGGFLTGIPDVKARSFDLNEVRTLYRLEGDGGYTPYYQWPSLICEAEIAGEKLCWTRERSSRHARSTTKPQNVYRLAEKLTNTPGSVLPVISYQSASRIWAQKREKNVNVFRKVYSRTVGYIDCIVDESSIKMMLNWCLKMEQIAWHEHKLIAEYEAVKQAVGRAMGLLDQKDTTIFYNRRTEELIIVQTISLLL